MRRAPAKKLASALLLLSLATGPLLNAQTAGEKVIEIETIDVTGTRYPGPSIIALLGLKSHDKVSEMDIVKACHRITATGLFKSVDYTYDVYPDRPGAVLHLAVRDESPLVPCSIKPAGDDATIWPALQSVDPIYFSQMPPTEKAIAFYEASITKWLETHGRPGEYAAAAVVGLGDPTAVVFEIRAYKQLPPKRGN
jgi:hypothetical protein